MFSRLRALFDCLIFTGILVGMLLTVSGLLGGLVPYLDLINHFQLPLFVSGFIAFLLTFVWPYQIAFQTSGAAHAPCCADRLR